MTTITPLALPEVLLITPKRHGDARGWFMETWSQRAFAAAGLDIDFVQDNHAFSGEAGTVRGLHFQTAPHAQAKLLRVLRGSILDVAVDVRAGSATYGRWISATLTASGGEQIFVPRGFAHGYCTLEPDTELAYKVDGLYAPETEGAVLWNDPDLAIDWPALAGTVLSDKDKAARPLKDLAPVSF
ncbi:MAG: dTDP-4-dehydrorhamnose 3,5-epimerase [Phenylobacterium sp.]|uniref:dTDP-4-dehydrorhamnose 3,5-epimerase n=1 Tax=Phenylobacterium sp. TaxID=1871053 RepID=UPI003BB71CF9